MNREVRPERSPITKQVIEWSFQKVGDFGLNLDRYLAELPPPLQSVSTEPKQQTECYQRN